MKNFTILIYYTRPRSAELEHKTYRIKAASEREANGWAKKQSRISKEIAKGDVVEIIVGESEETTQSPAVGTSGHEEE